LQKLRQYPILILLAINILIGLYTFKDYGLSWDEPYFYDYANSLGYAYSPREWFNENFNLENAYGASGTDHANRGPAYLLLAREPVFLLEDLGLDPAAAWHLINFLTFQFGVLLFYLLAKRWLNTPAALTSTALFAWQPLLWGHAFINPKDPPFLVFFLGAMYFGLKMVDDVAQSSKPNARWIITAAFFLGIATSIRVLGPFAGLLVGIYAISKISSENIVRWIKVLAAYGFVTALIAFISWPYLWTNPLQNFIEAFGFMSDNPTQLKVLFNGDLFSADVLPRRYFPVLLGLTLTEPVWFLFGIGAISAFWKLRKEKLMAAILVMLWIAIPFAYVLLRKPPMYDGYRHFLFILPPVFIFTGFALEDFYSRIHKQWIHAILVAILLLPPMIPAIRLHPYEYAYYNSLIGGTNGAFRRYETEYWLTCYKEAMEDLQSRSKDPATIYVHREAYIAAAYAKNFMTVKDERGALNEIKSGDYILVNSRSNEDLKTFRDAPLIVAVQRGAALFCAIKRIP
jgi:hypothetical protein